MASSTLVTGDLVPAGGASTAVASGLLTAAPSSPNSNDVEFEDTSLPSGWTEEFTVGATALDPYADFNSGDARRKIHTDFRSSWYSIQPVGDQSGHDIHKGFTIGTNFGVWIRFSSSQQGNFGGTNGADNGNLLLLLSDTSAGAISNNDRVFLKYAVATGTIKHEFTKTEGGGGSAIGTTDSYHGILGPSFNNYFLHKVGTTVYGWVFDDLGHSFLLGSTVYGGAALDRVGMRFSANNGRNAIIGVDFIRFTESATAVPWGVYP